MQQQQEEQNQDQDPQNEFQVQDPAGAATRKLRTKTASSKIDPYVYPEQGGRVDQDQQGQPAQAQAPEPAALPVDELAIAPPNDPSWRAEPPTAVAHTMSQMAALVQDCEAGDQQACDALELIEDERQNEPELLGGGELMSQSDDMESFRNAPARHSKPVGAWALGGASRGAQLKKKKWKGPVDTTVVVR